MTTYLTTKTKNMIHYPTIKLIFDRHKRASSTKEGAIELRITHQRQQRFATTGIRVLPKQWRDGRIVNRLDALELQQALDAFVLNAQRIIQERVQSGTLDMSTIVADINGRAAMMATMHTPQGRLVIDYMRERAEVRKYGRAEDSRERYDRFLRWFETWGQIRTFADITEANIMRMDEELTRKGMKDCSKWGNYHRFLNSFILDAIDEGIMQRNPYKHIHIKKGQEQRHGNREVSHARGFFTPGKPGADNGLPATREGLVCVPNVHLSCLCGLGSIRPVQDTRHWRA